MRALILSAAFGAALCGSALAAAPWTPDPPNTCNSTGTTVEIMVCLDARTKVWDARLNQAYQALTAMLKADPADPGQLDKLRAAQRLWLQYRNANCGFYDAEQGTIREIDAAECMHRMTQDRAIELQQAGPQG
jgi:uncharacterized protein YecT (DUF1311 family)